MFRYFFYNNGNPPQGNATDCMYYQTSEGMYVSSNSVHNFNAGVQAGYSWVKETIGSGEAGYTQYNFTNFNELNNHGEFPSSWRYGRLMQKSEFTSTNAEVRRTTYGNVIVLNPSENFAGHTAIRTDQHPCYSPGGMYAVHFDQKVYSFPCDWIYTDTIKVEDYMTGVTTLTVNSYDNPQHREMTRSTTYLSDGSKQTSFIKYPTDFALNNTPSGDAAAVARLQEKHMHNTPIEQYTQKWLPGSSQPLTLSAAYNEYRNGTTPANSVVTAQIHQLDMASGISNFQPAAASTNTISKDSRYTVKGTVEEYDLLCHPLTLLGEGQRKSGYIWGYNSTMPIAKVANDYNQNSRAFTSFEDRASGNWNYDPSAVIASDHLTGKKAYNLAQPGIAPIGIMNNESAPFIQGDYIVSYWKKVGGTVSVAGTTSMTTGTTANGWIYCEHLITNGTVAGNIQITGNAIIDELRFYPKNARMESFTYDPLVGITSRDDAGSRIILYEYDAMGRLSLEKDISGNIIKKYTYQYFGDQ